MAVSEQTQVFVGRSSEAITQAELVAEPLTEAGIVPLLWKDGFAVGDITLMSIEQIAKRVVGAVFLASPDDDSVIRQRKVKVPRANVLFEYGYLSARLTRSRVALCRYDDTELPSDLAGLTVIPMGTFSSDAPLPASARAILRTWARQLPRLPLLPAGWEDDYNYPPPLDQANPELSPEELDEVVRRRVPKWKVQERPGTGRRDGTVVGREGRRVGLTRTYMFRSFEDAIQFMQAASRYFGKAQHHPEWENLWLSLWVWLTSWDIGHRPSMKDVELAERLDRLFSEDYA